MRDEVVVLLTFPEIDGIFYPIITNQCNIIACLLLKTKKEWQLLGALDFFLSRNYTYY